MRGSKYTPEFKAEAVLLAQRRGSVRRAAGELGVGLSTLFEWVKQSRGEAPEREGATETPQEELQRLRRQVRTLEMERDFLKRVAAFFAKDPK